MNWDKTLFFLMREFKKSPTAITAIIYMIARIPILHCAWPSTDVCQDMKINLFIIEFPYKNITDFLFSAFFTFASLEFAIRVIPTICIVWHTRGVRKSLKDLKANVDRAEKSNGIDEHLTSAKQQIQEIEKKLYKMYTQLL